MFITSYVTIPSVKEVKQSNGTYTSAKISWKKVDKASGYEIYRSISKNGVYTKVGTSATNSFNNTKIATNKTYYYKVRAYRTSGNVKYYGTFSTPISAKTATKAPAVASCANTAKNKATVKWYSVTGATGYQVYMATSQTGSYKAIYTGTAKSYAKSGLVKGKTYYFKVRTYKTVGNIKIYSPFSTVKKVKITK